MRMAVVALQRRVAEWVTVHAAGALQNGAHHLERCDRIVPGLRCRRLRSRRRTVRARDDHAGRQRGENDAKPGTVYANLSGKEQSRCFVMTCTALATAAEIGATPGSPIPPIFASLSRTCT